MACSASESAASGWGCVSTRSPCCACRRWPRHHQDDKTRASGRVAGSARTGRCVSCARSGTAGSSRFVRWDRSHATPRSQRKVAALPSQQEGVLSSSTHSLDRRGKPRLSRTGAAPGRRRGGGRLLGMLRLPTSKISAVIRRRSRPALAPCPTSAVGRPVSRPACASACRPGQAHVCYSEVRGLKAPPRSGCAPAALAARAASRICTSPSTDRRPQSFCLSAADGHVADLDPSSCRGLQGAAASRLNNYHVASFFTSLRAN